ncbi:MAG: hypothetical protein H7338_07110 [Candidatus Sericytochromatia bacterium]|nr:hypothetical protein [Candidatus Sericytochromatia bacterium]
MSRSTLSGSFLLALAATVSALGCAPQPVTAPAFTSLGNPMTLVSMGNQGTGNISLSLNPQSGFQTKAAGAVSINDITFYNVELITDKGSSPATDYGAGIVAGDIKATVFLDGTPNATVVPGTLTDGSTQGAFAFTNVMPGTYRFRVKASKGATTPGTGPEELNKGDSVFTTNGGWEVSDGTATVSLGSGTAYSIAGNLACTLNLKDAQNDPVNVGITTAAGGAGPAIGQTDL